MQKQSVAKQIGKQEKYWAKEVVSAWQAYTGKTKKDLENPSSKRKDALPRQILMFLLYRDTGMSLVEIEKMLSKEHTTVLFGVRKVWGLIQEQNAEILEFIAGVEGKYPLESTKKVPRSALLDRAPQDGQSAVSE